MAGSNQTGGTRVIESDGDLSQVLGAPGPLVGAQGPSGLWLALAGDTVWQPDALVDAANRLLPKHPASTVRVLASAALLVDAVRADRAGGAVQPLKDQRHVITFFDRRKAPYSLFADEQIDALALMGCDILQFFLPDYGTEMYLVEECAQAAVAAGRAELATLAYAEAFRTNPHYALQPLYRDAFELVALQAGDAAVPGFRAAARALFDELARPPGLRQPPSLAGGARLRVFVPATPKQDEPQAYPAVAPTPGTRVLSDLLMFGALLVRFRYKDDLAPSEQVDFFTGMVTRRLQLDWDRMPELDRLKTERAAFRRFRTTLSTSGAVKPFAPQAVVLMQALRQGMPLKLAVEPLDKRITELENA